MKLCIILGSIFACILTVGGPFLNHFCYAETGALYHFELDYIKSVRNETLVYEDEFDTWNDVPYLSGKEASPEQKAGGGLFYLAVIGSLPSHRECPSQGVLHLRSSDAVPVPFGTDYALDIQQEFAVPITKGERYFEWHGRYQLEVRFIGRHLEDLIPPTRNGIQTYYDVVLCRFDPFFAVNALATCQNISLTKVYHDPKTDRDVVEEIATLTWEQIPIDERNPTITICLDLTEDGHIVASLSTDRGRTYMLLGETNLPDSNFRGEIITGAFGNPDGN